MYGHLTALISDGLGSEGLRLLGVLYEVTEKEILRCRQSPFVRPSACLSISD